MNIKINALGSTAVGASAAAAFASFGRFGSRIAFAPEGGAGDGGAAGGEGGADDGANKGGEPNKGGEGAGGAPAGGDGTKPTDAEAKLLKEVMDLKGKLKGFEGVDLVAYNKMVQAEKDAAAAKVAAELKAAQDAGDFERVKGMMAEQHAKDLQAEKDAKKEVERQLKAANKRIGDMRLDVAFANSKFITEDMALTPSKARLIYGAHFAEEGDTLVGYDKASGERTKLVDAAGKAFGFDDVMKRLVEADPEKDSLLRSKLAQGAGSSTVDSKVTNPAGEKGLTGIARIRAGLAKKAAAGK